MKTVTLHRFCHSGEMGTFGYALINDELTYFAERPWLDNRPEISCVPEGLYHVTKFNSPKFGRTWILEGGTVGHYTGVRTHILIHAGNVPMTDSLGCLLPGLKLGALNGKWAVLSSRNALARLKDSLPAEWDLYITSTKNAAADYIPA